MGNRNPFDHHHQFGPAHHAGLGSGIKTGKFQRSGLEPLIIENKSAFFPPKQLDPVTPVIDENEHFPGTGATTKLALDQSAEPVKAFAHVGGFPVQIITTGAGQGKHGLSS